MESISEYDSYQDLPKWVSNFDKRFLSKLDLSKKGHQYFNDTYNSCFNIRDDFRNNFLPKLESNLGFPSSRDNYKYEHFFKSHYFQEYELSKDYIYDDNINLLKKNFSTNNIFQNRENNIKISNDNNINNNIKKNYKINSNSQINNNKNKKENTKGNLYHIKNKTEEKKENNNKKVNNNNNVISNQNYSIFFKIFI